MNRKSRLKLRGGEGLLLMTSFLVALVVWFLSNLSRTYSGLLSVPVVAECELMGHSHESSNAAVVSARCRTSGFRLLSEGARQSRRPVKVRFERADIRHLRDDRFFVTGNVMNNYLQDVFGDKASVEAFITDTLFFTFPAENYKRVPVNLTGNFSYRSQYMASGPLRLVPDTVTVYGEQARLDQLDHISTAQLLLDDVHETQQGNIRLRRAKGVRLSDDLVSYELPVSRYVEVRSELPVTVRNAPAGHHLLVFPSRATVILRCTFPLGRDPFESIEVNIDYNDFASSLSGRCVARAGQLPSQVLDYRVEPAVFDCLESE